MMRPASASDPPVHSRRIAAGRRLAQAITAPTGVMVRPEASGTGRAGGAGPVTWRQPRPFSVAGRLRCGRIGVCVRIGPS